MSEATQERTISFHIPPNLCPIHQLHPNQSLKTKTVKKTKSHFNDTMPYYIKIPSTTKSLPTTTKDRIKEEEEELGILLLVFEEDGFTGLKTD